MLFSHPVRRSAVAAIFRRSFSTSFRLLSTIPGQPFLPILPASDLARAYTLTLPFSLRSPSTLAHPPPHTQRPCLPLNSHLLPLSNLHLDLPRCRPALQDRAHHRPRARLRPLLGRRRYQRGGRAERVCEGKGIHGGEDRGDACACGSSDGGKGVEEGGS